MTLLADAAGWIGAGAGVVGALAAIAALYGVFKWFRPEFRARIDGRCQAIRLDVTNDGRATGRVRKVAPVDEQLAELDARYAGVNQGRFCAAEIPGHSTWYLIVEAPTELGEFPEGTRLLVAWGRRKQRCLEIEPTKNVSYHGMNSDWPS